MRTTKSLQPIWPPLLTLWMLARIGPSMAGPGLAGSLADHRSRGVEPFRALCGREPL
jgi:hypothetical protein